VRRVGSFLCWFALLVGLWEVLVGTTQTMEMVAGLIAAALGAAFAELLRTMGLLRFSADLRLLAQGWKLPWQIVFDFLVVTWVLARSLARGQRVHGEWLTVPYPVSEDGERRRWQRAFATTAGTATPLAIVVDLDRDEALLHSLEPRVSTGREVL
jgi:multisubunit Na+/H+ antiporter MnhE subunit